MGSCTMATRPMITMRMEITIATIGRSMKYLATAGLLRRAGCGGRVRREPDLLAGPHPVAALDDDPLTGLKARRDDPERADTRVDLHRAHVDRVVRADHCHLMHALNILHGPLRDQERVLLHLDDDADLGVLAGTQEIPGIREDATRAHGAGGHVDLSIQRGGPPLAGIDGPVGQ